MVKKYQDGLRYYFCEKCQMDTPHIFEKGDAETQEAINRCLKCGEKSIVPKAVALKRVGGGGRRGGTIIYPEELVGLPSSSKEKKKYRRMLRKMRRGE